MQVKRYLVAASRECEQWLEVPQFCGVVDLDEWAQRQNTNRRSFRLYVMNGYTCAVEVLWKDNPFGNPELASFYGEISVDGFVQIRDADNGMRVTRILIGEELHQDKDGVTLTLEQAEKIGLDVIS